MGRVPQSISTNVTDDSLKQTQLLFPKPSLFVIAGKQQPVTPAVVHQISTSTVPSNVRLKSAYDCTFDDFRPKFVKYGASVRPLRSEMIDYLEQANVDGFGEGAIVARRWADKKYWLKCPFWGVILMERAYLPSNPRDDWAPFLVKWFSGNVVEGAWKEDLIVIHTSLEESLLSDIVEVQGVTVT